ncbi:hypothetical protein [uncultured Sphingomonas sp.]|uniref:hypothetical protein n=1 Tax=uncultured Sphingomonas sp. TaxID=158754 RepID=UPI0025F545F9|nr:hypothetical protein [uncultured Sphingomonas sp.]
MSRITTLVALSIAGTALAGCAATPREQAAMAERNARDAARLDQRLAGFTPGKPASCLPVSTSRRSEYFGDTIVYEVSGSLVYRTDTSGGCTLNRDDILVTQTPIGSLCRGDIARTIDRGSRFQTGSCTLGDFVPYRKDRS